MAIAFKSYDKEIHENGPYPAKVNGEWITVTERIEIDVSGNSSSAGYTNRSMRTPKYYNRDLEVDPEELRRIRRVSLL